MFIYNVLIIEGIGPNQKTTTRMFRSDRGTSNDVTALCLVEVVGWRHQRRSLPGPTWSP